MKIINKKTGEIATLTLSSNGEELLLMKNNEMVTRNVKLSDLEDWQDYEKPKLFYVVDLDSEILASNFEDKTIEKAKELGNYFETKEEAEKAVEKLKAWKRLKDKGFKIKGWKFTPDMKQIQGNYVKIEAEIPQILINKKDLDLLFGGEE